MLYYSSQYGTKSTPIQILSILINIVLAHSWRYSTFSENTQPLPTTAVNSFVSSQFRAIITPLAYSAHLSATLAIRPTLLRKSP